MTREERTCRLCGTPFAPVKAQVYCTADCRLEDGRRKARIAMREKRGSYKPHKCLDCPEEIVGRALRCETCKREDYLRRQRENKAKPESVARANALRRERIAADPETQKAREAAHTARKLERLRSDPEHYAKVREKRRPMERELAAKKRAEREAAILETLGDEQ